MKTIEERTAGLESQPGFVGLHYDRIEGKLLLELDEMGEELFYRCNLATGLGTTEIMLDRGQLEVFQLCRFERVGNRVLLMQKNLGYRFGIDDVAGRRTVEESFAHRIVCSLPIEAESGGRLVVDASTWLRGDSLQMPRRLTEQKLGKFKVDSERCAFHLTRTKAFPDNTEVEVHVTLQAEEPVPERLQRYLFDHSVATIRQRHSFRRLPATGYVIRELDPRVGYFAVEFHDYAQPADRPLDRRLMCRWRLEKSDPSAAVSRPRRPIRFYLERGIPEPYRSAIRDGALWWNEGFRAAGFEGAVEILDLPEDADPLDARISTILWVHRAERGWSVGWSASDPRTGEILESNVLLDSHRVRTCHEMWMALAGGDGGAGRSEEDFIVSRIRLLAAHEVGHALGLAHNFASATYERGSVMDYYAPRVGARDGLADLEDAYRQSLGTYDVWALRFGYTPFETGVEQARLAAILREGLEQGLHLLADHEAQDLGGSDPRAQQYSDGTDPVAELNRIGKVRHVLLEGFGLRNLGDGERYAVLRKRLGFVYLLHRFALQAAVKAIGGFYLSYAHQGDGQRPLRPVEATQQWAALHALLISLSPAELEIPAAVVELLAPEPLSFPASPDAMTSSTHPAFDPLEPGRQLARVVLEWLFEERRSARLVLPGVDGGPSLQDVVESVEKSLFWQDLPATPVRRALARVVQRILVDVLIKLAESKTSVTELRDAAEGALRRIRTRVMELDRRDRESQDHADALAEELDRFARREFRTADWRPGVGLPPGAPIADGTRGAGPAGLAFALDPAEDWL